MRRIASVLLLSLGTLSAPSVGQPCPEKTEGARDVLVLTRATFAAVPGWAEDRHAEAVPSFLRSCEKLAALKDDQPVGVEGHGGLAGQWRAACAAAAKVKPGDDAAAKAMFEAEFQPYQAAGKAAGTDGKLTGYAVAEVRGSRRKTAKFQTPMFKRPRDLVMVELSNHISDGHGRVLWGRLEDNGQQLSPFPTRQQIRTGALAGKRLELLYVDNPWDLFVAQVQGTAKATLTDGSVAWFAYDGKNGYPYKSLGGLLKEMGELKPGGSTMGDIRRWFEDHPERYDEIMDQLRSYVFFKESKRPGAVGAQGTVLLPERSLAVDRGFIALSTPVWVDTVAPVLGQPDTAPFRKLLVAQDTGGAILGAVRGDVYWGDDATAMERAGRMDSVGRFWVLLPNGVTQ